jgi:cell division protein FtsL
MNWLKFLVGLSALIIAGCAAYFSVTGLGVLFAGASVSVMVMASALELAKLVAATYLKQKWDEIGGFNKWYLTTSVAVLMLITSAGIFGYLSNAFQAQSLKLQVVDREIAVHQSKIDQNTAQITQLSTQITEFNTNQGKILDGGKVNSRLIRSIDNRDKEIGKINNKISDLQTQNAQETEKINEIKIKNLDLEKEVGGFRFVAEAFGVELKNVVKFFIFLIVIVFDPLAVALIIAFNGLIETPKKKRSRLLGEMMENDQKLGLYEVYGDSKEDIVENISKNTEDSGKNLPIEEETEILKENIRIPIDCDGDGIIDGYDTNGDGMIDEWKEIGPRNGIIPYYAKPEFNWNNKNAWINDQNAVNFWLNSKGGTFRELTRIKNENDNIKTY